MNQRQDTFGQYERGAGGRSSLYEDRTDAGARLADQLERYAGRDALVLAIPRGGVPVAREVARSLDADLDVIVARKLGAPGQEELAIGAVASDGTRYVNRELVRLLGLSDEQLDHMAGLRSLEAERRERRFRAGLPPLAPEGRIAIVVDDGLATGATMRAAVRSLRQRGADKLIVAVPVGSAEACDGLAQEADEVVCAHRPEPFYAVGLYYRDFEQTSDQEVERILREHRLGRAGWPAIAER